MKMKTKVNTEYKFYDIAYLGGENPLPVFSHEIQDLDIPVDKSMSSEDTVHLGWDNGRKVLPYKMQDRYTREMKKRKVKTVVIENDHIRAEILPELGARINSLYDKNENRELLYKNPYIRFANLAIRNAWFSGGIEWNIGQLGHSYFTCSPVYVAEIISDNSAPGVRIYEYERRKGLFWQVDLHLPQDSGHLFAHMRVENTTGKRLPMYWWTNIAVQETHDTRVVAAAREVIYMDMSIQNNDENGNYFYGNYGYGKSRLPHIPPLEGGDATYPRNYMFSSEIYYQCQGSEMPWGASIEKEGYGFLEASTRNFPVKKMFCSGMHQGGKHWKEFLSKKGEAYIELQAGFGRTQQHSIPMEPGEVWEWTELFGPVKTDPDNAYSGNWETVVDSVEKSVHSVIKPEIMDSLDRKFRDFALLKPERILQRGSGWGALEVERRRLEGLEGGIPASMIFPDVSIGEEEKPWLVLLKKGSFPEKKTGEIPGTWMVQDDWIDIMEKSISKDKNWFSFLHYGVMLMENNREKDARKAWEESVRLCPSSWAFRNLGQLAIRGQDFAKALVYYKKAWEKTLEDGIMDSGIVEEYLSILNKNSMFDEALDVYEQLSDDMQRVDRIRVIRGRIAFEENDLDTLGKILKTEFACIREGETELTDLWFGMWGKKLAMQRGTIVTDAIKNEVKEKYPPPENIDFRKISR